MADDVTRRLLEIIITARNDSAAALRSASADVTGLQASMASAGKAALTAGAGLGLVAGGLALGMGALIKQAADYQTALQNVRGNTTLTTADMNLMHDAVLRMGTESGANFDQLSTGIMHAANVGYTMADSLKIADAGMKSAVASGSDAGQVINTLATAMREFNAPASEAGRIMDELHVAAASGNATLEQFVEGASKAHAMAAALHMPLEQIDAAFVAMTRHGFDVATSSTYLTGMLSKMVGPSAGATAELQRLSLTTGINLVSDFQHVGQEGYSLTKVMTDLRTATASMADGHKMASSQIRELGQAALAQGMTQKEANAVMKAAGTASSGQVAELFRLIPAMRGGLAAMVLTGAGFNDLTEATLNTTAAIRGEIIPAMGVAGPTAVAYAEAQKTVGNEMARLRNTIQGTAIVLGEALLPQFNALMDTISPLVAQFSTWTKAHADLIAHILPLVTALAAVGSAVLLVAGTVTLFLAVINPVSAAVVVASALAVAWATNLGGLRSVITEIAQGLLVLGVAFGVWRAGAVAIGLYTVANEALALAVLAVRIGMVGEMVAAAGTAILFAQVTVVMLAQAAAAGIVRAATIAWTLATAGLAFAMDMARGGGILFAAQAVILATAAGIVRGATLLWAGAQWLLNVALDANPLGLLIIALAAVTAGVIWAYQNVGFFHDAVNGLWSFISGTLGPAVGGLAHVFGDVLGGAISFAMNLLKGFLQLIEHIPGVSLPKFTVPDIGSATVGNTFAAAGLSGGSAGGALPPSALNTLNIAPFRALTAPLVGGPAMPTLPTLTSPSSTAGLPGLVGAGGGASSPITINVTVAADAVQIRSGGKADSAQKDYGTKVGEAIADALALFARGEQAATPGARTLLPGAR